MALKPRTGNQYVISSGEWSAVVTELGASLRELKWRGEDLIVPFDPNKVIPCCNGWVLAPYPNRVTNGQYSFDGEDYQMPILCGRATAHPAVPPPILPARLCLPLHVGAR